MCQGTQLLESSSLLLRVCEIARVICNWEEQRRSLGNRVTYQEARTKRQLRTILIRPFKGEKKGDK